MCTRLQVAPPISSGICFSRKWASFSISLATYCISSRLGVIRPERPTMSAPSSFALASTSWQGTITPMFTTSKLLHWSTTVTMFLPMSCTSPLTVAITILPLVFTSWPAAAWASFSASM
ncbi:hypothetical protein Y695_02614 [Hydrogenophaga sp. T4]|nr:hypothetical protein Y695_02614 [Hydrogenophaga sp. T4]